MALYGSDIPNASLLQPMCRCVACRFALFSSDRNQLSKKENIMNHTQRIEETARRHRQLTRNLAKNAVETYLALLAEEIANGEWVEILGVGKIQVVKEDRRILSIATDNRLTLRLRTKVRLL